MAREPVCGILVTMTRGTSRGRFARPFDAEGLPPATHGWRGHVAVVVLVVGATAAPTEPRLGMHWSWAAFALNVAAAALLLGRHRAPRTTLALVSALAVVSALAGVRSAGLPLAVAFAVFAAVPVLPRVTARWLSVGLATAMLLVWVPSGRFEPQFALLVLLGGALGEGAHARRLQLEAITERAERAERTRDALARQRVAEDRLLIARDLHDVVAHQIAVISLNAGVASSLLRERPDDAARALGVVSDAARTVLAEIGGLLATLRDPAHASVGPPGLDQLEDVVRDYATLGLEVSVRVDGVRRALPSAVDVTALRVVQEALANAHKHGALGRAHVAVTYEPRALRVVVTNPVSPSARQSGPGTRQGLVGMGERVESVRGTLEFGVVGANAWVVTATLPANPVEGAQP